MALCGTPAQPSWRELSDLAPLFHAARSRATGLDGKELALVLRSVQRILDLAQQVIRAALVGGCE